MTVSVRVAIPGVPICEIRRYPRQDPQRTLGCQRTARNGVRRFTLKFAGFWWGFRYEASRSGMARYVQMAPRVGIEPTTNGLTVRRSTAELPGNGRGRERRRILRFRPRIVKNPRGPMAHDRAAGPESKHALRLAHWMRSGLRCGGRRLRHCAPSHEHPFDAIDRLLEGFHAAGE